MRSSSEGVGKRDGRQGSEGGENEMERKGKELNGVSRGEGR